MKRFVLIFSLLLFSFPLFGKIKLSIDIVDTIGGDKGLVLVSELHSVEIIEDQRTIKLKMKSGISVELYTYYVIDIADHGPSPKVKIIAKIYQDGKLLKSFDKDAGPIVILGTPARFIFNDDNKQLLEITVVPESL